MSVINQVLKDLDRQGANTRAPSGVVAVNQSDVPQPRLRRMALAAGVAVLLTAAWWFWRPAPENVAPGPLQPAPAAPQLRLSQELTQVASPSLHAPAEATITGVPTAPPPKANALPPRIAFVPQPPRLDTRLPEPRQTVAATLEPKSVEARSAVVKDIKQATPQVQAEDAWRQANRLLEQGRNHDARERLETALQLDPNHDTARQSLVALLLEAGNVVPAEAQLREGIAQQPSDAWYPRTLAQLHLQRGDYLQAAAILKAGIERRADDAANWALYAGTLNRLNRPEESAAAYREALRREPAQGAWWVALGVVLERAGARAEAVEAFARALQTRMTAELRDFAGQRVRALQ